MQVSVRYTTGLGSWDLVFLRSFFCTLLAGFTLKFKALSFRPKKPKLVFLRSLCGTCGLACFIYTIQHLDLAVATVLQSMSGVLLSALSLFFLNDKLSKIQLLSLAFCLIGVGCISELNFFDSRIFPITIGLLAAFFSALAYFIVSFIGNEEISLRLVFYFPLVAAIVSFPLSKKGILFLQPNNILPILILALSTHLAQIYMTSAYQLEKPSRLVPLNYLGLALSGLCGWILFHEILSFYACLGIVFIIIAQIFNRRSKFVPQSSLPPR